MTGPDELRLKEAAEAAKQGKTAEQQTPNNRVPQGKTTEEKAKELLRQLGY